MSALLESIAVVVRLCAAERTAIVPQGGDTGLTGGATPDPSGTQIILSLSCSLALVVTPARQLCCCLKAPAPLCTRKCGRSISPLGARFRPPHGDACGHPEHCWRRFFAGTQAHGVLDQGILHG